MIHTLKNITQNVEIQQPIDCLDNKEHNLVEWWLQLGDITPKEHAIINQPCNYNKMLTVDTNWEEVQERMRLYLPYQGGFNNNSWDINLNGYNLYLGKGATELIYEIFKKEVDDNTLIITSVVEHPAVNDAIERLGRTGIDHVRINYENGIRELNISQVMNACKSKQYKKAFVMIIGTQVSTGEITPQKFFIKLKNYLESQGIQTTMAIDDVQGMYLVPRNYNIFDYAIFSAHILVRPFVLGLVWSKKKLDFGYQYTGWVQQLLPKLKIMLKFQQKFNTFSEVLKDEFREYLYRDDIQYMSDSVPYIFSMKVKCPPRVIYSLYDKDAWLEDYEVKLESDNILTNESFYIRLRAAQYITTPEKLVRAIPQIKKMLDNVIEYNGSIND